MGVQSVARALAILRVIADEPAGLVDISSRAGLPLTTTSRLLETLLETGAVTRDPAGMYRVGPLVRELAGAPLRNTNIQEIAFPELVGLVDTLDEAACLSIVATTETHTVVQFDRDRAVQAQDWTGRRWPMTAGGSGAVILASWPDDRVTPLLAGLVPADRNAALERIEAASRQGVAWSEGDYVDGVSSVAAAVHDRHGVAVAAIISYGPSYRFPVKGKRKATEQTLLAASKRLSQQIA